MKPLVVTYYTDDGYSNLARMLMDSCEMYGLECRVEKRPDLGSWERNCGQKPEFLWEMLAEEARPLLWVDADAQIVQPLEIDYTGGDIGLCYVFGRYRSGTVLIWNTERAQGLLRAWGACQKNSPDRPDEEVLHDVVADLEKHGLRVQLLPPSWLYVFDVWKREFPDVEPVILHKQASRVHRRLRKRAGRGTSCHPDVRRVFSIR